MKNILTGKTCYNCDYPLFDRRCINPDCKEYSLLTYIHSLRDRLDNHKHNITVTVFQGCIESIKLNGKLVTYKVVDLDVKG